uniref:NACHT and WD repeat domain containing 2 n=1 Tax=Salvator merianae TaxID=96440 RepID=A0A8D0DJM6_SALMN
MWPSGAAGKLPCPRDSALRRAAFSGNLSALPLHLAPSGRSVRVFISANPEAKTLDSDTCLRRHMNKAVDTFHNSIILIYDELLQNTSKDSGHLLKLNAINIF